MIEKGLYHSVGFHKYKKKKIWYSYISSCSYPKISKGETVPKQLFTFTVWHNGDSWLLSLSLLGQNDMVTLINSLCYTSFISHGSGCLLYSICPRLSQISAVSLSQTHMPVYLELQEWVSLRTENIQAQNRAAVTFELPQRGGGGSLRHAIMMQWSFCRLFFFERKTIFYS